MANAGYKRILLKLSGEALLGSKTSGIDEEVARSLGSAVKEVSNNGIEIALVIGGGNIYRGINAEKDGIHEETGHYMGMLAITMNCLALSDIFKKIGLDNIVLSAYGEFDNIEKYEPANADHLLQEGKVLLLAGGTGKPFCSTDTAAAVRAQELNCDLVVKMTKVDGVYDSDPVVNQDAKRYQTLTYQEAIEKDLKVMDQNAFSICQQNNIKIEVCKMEADNIKKIADGQTVGTIISNN